MMRVTTGFAAHQPGAALTLWDFSRRDVADRDIAVQVSYVGVCHSDLDAVRPDTVVGTAGFPLVPGHEFVGRVSAIGAGVDDVAVGDLVAVGNIVDSCRVCGPCRAGKQHFCDSYPTLTYGAIDRYGDRTQGAYSAEYVVDRDFAYLLPPGLDPAGVAPLMCAGITTYSPLRRWGVGPGSAVAIVGVGGLGHIAAKLAMAMGAEVVGFVIDEEKAAKAAALGVRDVVNVSDSAVMKEQFRRFDIVLDTVPVAHEIDAYLKALKVEGTLCSLGIVDRIPFDPLNLIIGGKAIAGAGSGGIPETQEMLEFCGAHGVVAEVEILPMGQCNEALDRLHHGTVDYRLVLDATKGIEEG